MTMEIFSKSDDESWIRSKYSPKEIKKKMQSIDVCVSDLGDTDADSPARLILERDFDERFMNDIKHTAWYLKWIAKFWIGGKEKFQKNESGMWKEFIERFWDEESIKKEAIHNVYAASDDLIYPGVETFYSLLPKHAAKIYMTRETKELATPFYEKLSFTGMVTEAFDKELEMERFIINNPKYRSYLIKGDSDLEKSKIDVLEFYKKKGYVKDVISIHVSETPDGADEDFCVNIGRDYRSLNNILNKML